MAVSVRVAPLTGALQSDQQLNERFYKFGTPSPSASSPAAVYSDLEDSGFHSDEDMQKVSSVFVY